MWEDIKLGDKIRVKTIEELAHEGLKPDDGLSYSFCQEHIDFYDTFWGIEFEADENFVKAIICATPETRVVPVPHPKEAGRYGHFVPMFLTRL